MLRKINAVLAALILILFLIHGIAGTFQMLGVMGTWHKVIARTAEGLIWIHMAIGLWYTFVTLRVQKKTGTAYFKENRLFWARRLSGFAVMILLFLHFNAFTTETASEVRLVWFDTFRLTGQILLIIAVSFHVLTNIKPMLISFGIRTSKERLFDILFVISVLLLIMAAGFAVYYLRWNS